MPKERTTSQFGEQKASFREADLPGGIRKMCGNISVHHKNCCALHRKDLVRRRTIVGDVVTHVRPKNIPLTIFMLDGEVSSNNENEMPFGTPMVGKITRAVINTPHLNLAKLTRTRRRNSSRARKRRQCDLRPVRNSKKYIFKPHWLLPRSWRRIQCLQNRKLWDCTSTTDARSQKKPHSEKRTSQDLAARVYGIGNASSKMPVMIYTVRRSPFKSHSKGLFGIPPDAETQNDGAKLKVCRNNINWRAQKLPGPAK
jgi:hypothetical protein